jgi:predicted metal-binding membrane protein
VNQSDVDHLGSAVTERGRAAATPAALTVTLGIAAASWAVAIRQMSGMDMEVATRLGSFGFFVVLWVLMMAAMMLPGAVPAVVSRAHTSGQVRAVPAFVAQKLLPRRAALYVPLALAIIGLGILIIVAPSTIPGLMPAM